MNFVILIVLCLLTAILREFPPPRFWLNSDGIFYSRSGQSADYFEIDAEPSNNNVLDSVIIFWWILTPFDELTLTGRSALIVFQNIVPISLYITIEIVKTVCAIPLIPLIGQIQAFFIYQDIEMYYPDCRPIG